MTCSGKTDCREEAGKVRPGVKIQPSVIDLQDDFHISFGLDHDLDVINTSLIHLSAWYEMYEYVTKWFESMHDF